jgi:FkbM family methyltransferase
MKNPLRSAMKRVYRLRASRPILAKRRGVNLLLSPHNWIDNRLLAGADYENKQLERARSLIRDHQLDTVIDIGANIGLYTVVLGSMPEISTTWAFEPVRRNFAQLMGNVFVNGLSDRVEARNLALGESVSSAVIHINPRSTGVSRLDLVHTKAPNEFIAQETIRIERLDDVCQLHDRRIFMKVDVEGHADAVIAGAAALLRGNAIVMQMEVAGAEARVRTRLADAGFTSIGQIDDDMYFSNLPQLNAASQV